MNIEEYAVAHPKDKPAEISETILKSLESMNYGSSILDIGCAEGATIEYLSSIFGNKFNYIGIDLSKKRISIAKLRKVPNSKFVVSNAEKTGFPDGSFDCILCSQLLEHVKNEKALLSEISRLLRPNGIYQIDTVYKEKWAWYFYRAPIGWALDPTHLREYTNIDTVKKLIEESGLEIDNIHTEQMSRNLKQIGLFNFEFPIPGYYTLFVLGKKK